MRAEAVAHWSQHGENADPAALAGPGFLYEFAEVLGNPPYDGVAIPDDMLRRHIAVARRFTCQLSETLLLFRQTGDTDWTRIER